MRLIDADKLDIYDVSPAYGMCVMGVTQEDIDDAPTVEAIPMWFIKGCQSDHLIFITELLNAWEKRKDNRRCGICKHFLGGGDFGTCCDQTYELKYRDSKVCEKYSERKEE